MSQPSYGSGPTQFGKANNIDSCPRPCDSPGNWVTRTSPRSSSSRSPSKPSRPRMPLFWSRSLSSTVTSGSRVSSRRGSTVDARPSQARHPRAPHGSSVYRLSAPNSVPTPTPPADLGPSSRTLTIRVADWLMITVAQAAAITTPSLRQASLRALATPTLAVLRSAGIVDDPRLRDRIIGAVCEPTLRTTTMLVDVMQSSAALPPADRDAIGVSAIAHHCRRALEAELARPPRADDDWSITEFESGHCCDDCTTRPTSSVTPRPDRSSGHWPSRGDNTSTNASTKPNCPSRTTPPGRAAPTSSCSRSRPTSISERPLAIERPRSRSNWSSSTSTRPYDDAEFQCRPNKRLGRHW